MRHPRTPLHSTPSIQATLTDLREEEHLGRGGPDDGAGARAPQPRHDAQEGGLARARVADDEELPPRGQVQGEVPHLSFHRVGLDLWGAVCGVSVEEGAACVRFLAWSVREEDEDTGAQTHQHPPVVGRGDRDVLQLQGRPRLDHHRHRRAVFCLGGEASHMS